MHITCHLSRFAKVTPHTKSFRTWLVLMPNFIHVGLHYSNHCLGPWYRNTPSALSTFSHLTFLDIWLLFAHPKIATCYHTLFFLFQTLFDQLQLLFVFMYFFLFYMHISLKNSHKKYGERIGGTEWVIKTVHSFECHVILSTIVVVGGGVGVLLLC